jgi:hypothetical protein
MNTKRRKQCGDKYRWPSMEAAKRHCWERWMRGTWIQAYRCRHCGGIHVGHFRQDDLPKFEVIMSKTRVYSIFSGHRRIGCIHLDKNGALEELAYYQDLRIMEKEIDEEEHARLVADYMEQQHMNQLAEQERPLPEDWIISRERPRPMSPDSMMSEEKWRPSDPEPPPKRRSRK